MPFMQSSNPALNQNAFSSPYGAVSGDVMTIEGTVNKTLLSLGLVLIGGWFGFTSPAMGSVLLLPGIFLTLGIAIALIFKKSWAPFLTPVYAVIEGIMLGVISLFFETRFPGIAMQSVTITCLTFAALLMAYRNGWIQATEKFKLGLFAATAGISLFYIFMLVAGLFGFHAASNFYNSASPMSIGLSAIICIVAAFNVIMDFDFIEKGAVSGNQPKYMEWYGAFALMVTVVWLYMEVLRLAAKLRERD